MSIVAQSRYNEVASSDDDEEIRPCGLHICQQAAFSLSWCCSRLPGTLSKLFNADLWRKASGTCLGAWLCRAAEESSAEVQAFPTEGTTECQRCLTEARLGASAGKVPPLQSITACLNWKQRLLDLWLQQSLSLSLAIKTFQGLIESSTMSKQLIQYCAQILNTICT